MIKKINSLSNTKTFVCIIPYLNDYTRFETETL